jgi:hypothetical protein
MPADGVQAAAYGGASARPAGSTNEKLTSILSAQKEARMTAIGVRRGKARFPVVQVPPGDRSSRNQPRARSRLLATTV